MASQEEYLSRIIALYNRYGVRGLSIERTAKMVGVTKRTLYNNFGTREELLISIVNHSLSAHHDKMIEIASHTERNAVDMQVSFLRYLYASVDNFSILFIESLCENYPEVYQLLAEGTERKLKEFWAMNIPRGRSDRLYRQDFDIDTVASFVYAGLSSCFKVRNLTPKEINDIINFTLRGICI